MKENRMMQDCKHEKDDAMVHLRIPEMACGSTSIKSVCKSAEICV